MFFLCFFCADTIATTPWVWGLCIWNEEAPVFRGRLHKRTHHRWEKVNLIGRRDTRTVVDLSRFFWSFFSFLILVWGHWPLALSSFAIYKHYLLFSFSVIIHRVCFLFSPSLILSPSLSLSLFRPTFYYSGAPHTHNSKVLK